MLIALAGVGHGVRHAVDHKLIRKGEEHLPRLSGAADEACRQQELQPRRHGCEFLVAGLPHQQAQALGVGQCAEHRRGIGCRGWADCFAAMFHGCMAYCSIATEVEPALVS